MLKKTCLALSVLCLLPTMVNGATAEEYITPDDVLYSSLRPAVLVNNDGGCIIVDDYGNLMAVNSQLVCSRGNAHSLWHWEVIQETPMRVRIRNEGLTQDKNENACIVYPIGATDNTNVNLGRCQDTPLPYRSTWAQIPVTGATTARFRMRIAGVDFWLTTRPGNRNVFVTSQNMFNSQIWGFREL